MKSIPKYYKYYDKKVDFLFITKEKNSFILISPNVDTTAKEVIPPTNKPTPLDVIILHVVDTDCTTLLPNVSFFIIFNTLYCLFLFL